jgi:hypothetical protein
MTNKIVDLAGLLSLGICHRWSIDGNGFVGMLFAHAEIALGGILKQILQGAWLPIQTIQLQFINHEHG